MELQVRYGRSVFFTLSVVWLAIILFQNEELCFLNPLIHRHFTTIITNFGNHMSGPFQVSGLHMSLDLKLDAQWNKWWSFKKYL